MLKSCWWLTSLAIAAASPVCYEQNSIMWNTQLTGCVAYQAHKSCVSFMYDGRSDTSLHTGHWIMVLCHSNSTVDDCQPVLYRTAKESSLVMHVNLASRQCRPSALEYSLRSFSGDGSAVFLFANLVPVLRLAGHCGTCRAKGGLFHQQASCYGSPCSASRRCRLRT